MAISRRKLLLAAPALLLTRRADALLHRGSASAPASLLTINLVPDANWSGAPSFYQSAVITAANMIMAAFPNTNCTINIEVGYQFLENVVSVPPLSSIGSPIGTAFLSYSAIRAGMVANNKTTTMNTLLSNTPAGTSLNGQNSFNVATSPQKALGLNGISPTAPGIDGAIGIGSGWGSNEIVGVCLHEMTHAMDRVTGDAPYCFSRFISAGNRDFGSSTANTYFAIDGGTVHLADYGISSDAADFLNGGVQDGATLDSFDEHQDVITNQFLTTVDIQLMNTLGFQ